MGSPSANGVLDHHCPECPRSFKRLEHLKRHRRSHGVSRLYACSVCPKTFARSDVLRRHISSHDATAIDGAVGPRKRACFECARLRERCTKGQPCSRCYTKSLECIYPVSATSPGKMQNTETGTVLPTGSSRLSNGPLPDGSRGQQTAGEPPTPGTGPVQDPDATRGLHAMHDQSDTNSSAINCETGFGYLENFPVNWLDLDYEMDLDLTSMLGQGFSVTNNPPTVAIVEGSKGAIDPMAMQPSTSWDGPQQIPYPYDPKDATVTAFTPALRGNDHTPTSMSTSCTTNQTPTHTPELPMGTPIRGDFYLDSAVGSRTPCTARFIKRSTALSLTGTTPIQRLRWASNEGKASCATTLFAFPETNHIFWGGGSEDQSFKQTLELGTFREIELQFQRHCCDSSGIFTPFSNHRFLQHRDLQLFLHLYFKHFDPIFPIIHSAVADVNTYWLLAVAACAIGSQYTETQDYAGCVEPLHEFLRRALLSESERGLVGVQELPFQIARSLSYLRGFYSQSCRSAVNTTQNSFPSALGIIEANKTGPDQQQYHHSNSEATIWARDLVTETKSRIQLFQMLLEAMSAYTLGIDNHPISPQVLETSLPNHALWSTASSSEWADCHHQQPLPSLFSAIDTIFRDKSFDSRLCEFGRLILLHGVYSQVGMMQRIHSGPLGNWTPSLREPELETAFTSHEAGSSHGLKPLTSHQLSNWRSAGLDCVDVLHWAANGTIAAASGFENPLVMHLHFSRTLVSAPVSSIQLLATFLASQTPTSLASEQPVFSRDDAAIAEHRIIEWAQRDQCKARLAVLHCGCLFWHMRRYSRRAFYEPTSVFLATLTIWAYSSYASRAELQKQSVVGNSPSVLSDVSDESDTMPSFVRLDRPNDDEMVQCFVRSGAPGKMKAHITGVGDIYSSRAPSKILREGMKLLDSVSTAWGRNPNDIHLLHELAELTGGANNAASRGRQ